MKPVSLSDRGGEAAGQADYRDSLGYSYGQAYTKADDAAHDDAGIVGIGK